MNQIQEHAASAALSKITYSSSAATIFFGLTANELAALIGACVAVLAWLTKAVMDWHFKGEHLKLAKARLAAGQNPEEPDDE